MPVAMTGTALETGWAALQRGDLAAARIAFEQATAAAGQDVRGWLLLAQCCAAQDDRAAEEHALDRALAAEPRNRRVAYSSSSPMVMPCPPRAST
jgi:Tfp pilus assembly protein PilF